MVDLGEMDSPLQLSGLVRSNLEFGTEQTVVLVSRSDRGERTASVDGERKSETSDAALVPLGWMVNPSVICVTCPLSRNHNRSFA